MTEEYQASLPPECPSRHSRNLEPTLPPDEQSQTEIECRAVRRRFIVHRGRCGDCDAAVTGPYPLQTSTATRDRFEEGQLSPHGLRVVACRLTAQLERMARGGFTHDGNRRLANFLHDHLRDIFAYLRHPGMAATNCRGEQAIRPAVVNRKVWGGNRTWPGSRTQSVLMSVLGTCLLCDLDPLVFLIEAPPPRPITAI